MTQAGAIQTSPSSPPQRMSYQEFLEFPHENQHVEWIDGRVVPMPAVTDSHSDVTLFLGSILRLYTESKQLGVIRGDPFNMKTGAGLPGRQPDLLFLRHANRSRLQASHLEGPADLVVEVISPGTRRTDRVDKFQEYERGGVPEYLIVDPERHVMELYRLTDGRYEEVLPDEGGALRSAVIEGFWLRPEWLTRFPLPPMSRVLAELGVSQVSGDGG